MVKIILLTMSIEHISAGRSRTGKFFVKNYKYPSAKFYEAGIKEFTYSHISMISKTE